MRRESLSSIKAEQRTLLREIRASISEARRKEAEDALFLNLKDQLQHFNYILSFVSLQEEIQLSTLNFHLAAEKKLLLPRRSGDKLTIHRISDLTSLEYRKPLWEPSQSSSEISLDKIECILIPGLGFDKKMQRIGYGKGYYDHLLHTLNIHNLNPLLIGVGFKEQLVPELPIDAHDMPLDKLLLF
ncbi:MAG: 5-formyltetrahydrofolate cyclo-ligase [Chlamydiales bacterium]|nr:5-formyltetrahydrofolate cyclo-ligase [Chlamydiales bacterium]